MIRVLVIDDSALIRKLMTTILSADPEIEVVGVAMNAKIARRKISHLEPDVVTLDFEMPDMDRFSFLRSLMRARPMPVVVVSKMSQAEPTLRALELGAVDFIAKPQSDVQAQMLNHAEEIVHKVKAAAQANLTAPRISAPKPQAVTTDDAAGSHQADAMIIAIGASTGGTEAIKDVLGQLPRETPGIVISQHIPGTFSGAFAERLNQNTDICVCEAQDGQVIRAGHAYLAPGNRHLRISRADNQFVCRLDDGPEVNRHKPSVDVMFESVAMAAGTAAVGILLTGMGHDGAAAMGRLQAAGAVTIAQDQASSVVWGMPGEAVKRGFADLVLPLPRIGEKLLQIVSQHR